MTDQTGVPAARGGTEHHLLGAEPHTANEIDDIEEAAEESGGAPPKNLLDGMVKALRPRQWVKNVLVIAAPAACRSSLGSLLGGPCLRAGIVGGGPVVPVPALLGAREHPSDDVLGFGEVVELAVVAEELAPAGLIG